MKLIIGGFVLFFVLTMSGVRAEASQETTISVAPAILDLAVTAGEKTNAIITIRNGGDAGLPISVTPQSLLQDDEIIPNENQSKSDASKWISSEDSEFLLGARESRKLLFAINIPADASPGGHYAQISIRGLSLESDENSGVSIVVPEIAVTVLISVAGEVKTSMYLIDKNILPFFVTPATNYLSEFEIVNDGNIHDLVTPTCVVMKGTEEIYRKELVSKIVLPQTKKRFNEILKLPDDYGEYRVYLEIKYANGQKEIISNPETLVVFRPLPLVIIMWVSTFCSLYLYHHRNNIRNAWTILIQKNT